MSLNLRTPGALASLHLVAISTAATTQLKPILKLFLAELPATIAFDVERSLRHFCSFTGLILLGLISMTEILSDSYTQKSGLEIWT
jgi:hypothetical protein